MNDFLAIPPCGEPPYCVGELFPWTLPKDKQLSLEEFERELTAIQGPMGGYVISLLGPDAEIDDTPDASTNRITLVEDAANNRWSMRVLHHLTSSLDLNGDYDIKQGVDLDIQFQVFPELSPSALKYLVIQGAALKKVSLDYTNKTLDIKLQPTLQACNDIIGQR